MDPPAHIALRTKGNDDANQESNHGSNHSSQENGDMARPLSSSATPSAAAASSLTSSFQSLSAHSSSSSKRKNDLPRLFYLMELGEWEQALERLRRHPREAKVWATLRTKSEDAAGSGKSSGKGTKRLALHHAAFKLRSAANSAPSFSSSSSKSGSPSRRSRIVDDPYCMVCQFILNLIRLYPDAAGQRESRHGCLPLHLAAFASCAPRAGEPADVLSPQQGAKGPSRPASIALRVASDATTRSTETNLSAVHAEETYTGTMTGDQQDRQQQSRRSRHEPPKMADPNVSVSMRRVAGGGGGTNKQQNTVVISPEREEMAVKVVNALLDAFPKAIRVDSEGGRLPLHTACAGRATPRVISTLVTAYPSAARHRNKDGFLPLHLSAHWGVSHPDVAIILLKSYPDATVGRNRWERTPLEEALCMAGENGRPHQSALVRALRKHPSYWTRPTQSDLNPTQTAASSSRKSTIVDVDESLPSSDSTTLEEQLLRGYDRSDNVEEQDGNQVNTSSNGHGLMSLLTPRAFAKKGNKENEDEDVAAAVEATLPTLIQTQKWNSVLARLKREPQEAEDELQVLTRGGFYATTGMTPLHYACERRPPGEVVQALIEVYPMAVMMRTMPGGALPLHIACTWHSAPDAVNALLAADPGACRVTDELGNVPLHSACFSGAPLEVIEALLETDCDSVLARNHQGSRAIDICKRLRHENRRSAMATLTLKREELLAAHRRSRSSGILGDVAREAAELNERYGAAPGENGYVGDVALQEDAVGVEVSYQGQGQDTQELVWI